MVLFIGIRGLSFPQMIKNAISMSKTSSISKTTSSTESVKCGDLMSWLKRKEVPLEKGTAANISFVGKSALGLLSLSLLRS